LTKLDQVAFLVRLVKLGQERVVEVINLYEAKTQLSRLVERAAAGEEIVIAKAGRPVARLVKLAEPKPERQLGFLRGEIWIGDNFDDPLPQEMQDAFDGKGP